MKIAFTALTLALASLSAQATPIYVGSYKVTDGPDWHNNPAVYSATEAAALIFGGQAQNYFTSINSSQDASTITHTGWYDGWDEHTGMIFNENYKLDVGEPGYNSSPWAQSARSAYINDGLHGDFFINYVWRVAELQSSGPIPVPEPQPWILFGLGGIGLSLLRRKKSQP
jgi:hypothetical protein